jgi:hypothetical protein
VPHILAYYEENGEEILKESAEELYEYYSEVIKAKLNEFIDNSYLIRPRKHIEYINLKLNFLYKIEESKLRVEKPIEVSDDFFVSVNKPNILLIKSSNTFHTCISKYQYLTSKSIYFAMTDLRNYLAYKDDDLMKSSDFNILIIDLNSNSKLDFKNDFE